MGMVLQVLGLVFLVVVLVAVGFLIFLALKVRAMFRTLKDTIEKLPAMAAMSPSRIHLVPMAAPAWENADAVKTASEPLPELGFQLAGTYQVEEIPAFNLQGWVKPEQAVASVVYEHPQAGVWLDFFTHFEDGTRITFANSNLGGVDHAPGHTVERHPTLGTKEMFEKFLAARPDRPARTITADTFVPVFEKAYADEMDWRNSRGGPTEDEIRSVAALSGKAYSDEEVSNVREVMRRRALEDLQEALRERFLEQSALSAVEWEDVRERLVIVHDKLTPEILGEYVSPWSDDDEPAPFEGMEGSPREAFIAFNRGRPKEQRFRKLGELTEPIEAYVYCAPED
jgi:hypothetical protein